MFDNELTTSIKSLLCMNNQATIHTWFDNSQNVVVLNPISYGKQVSWWILLFNFFFAYSGMSRMLSNAQHMQSSHSAYRFPVKHCGLVVKVL